MHSYNEKAITTCTHKYDNLYSPKKQIQTRCSAIAERPRCKVRYSFCQFPLQRGSVDPKVHVERVAPTNHSSSQKIKLNDVTYGIYISGQIFLPIYHNLRMCQTDGRTDGQTEFSSQDRVCIPCSAVKSNITDMCHKINLNRFAHIKVNYIKYIFIHQKLAGNA